jgi:methylenetetrahydrofolate reductase (NADPH)
MRVTDLWTKNARPTLSFEFFPPRSEKDEASFAKVVDTLAELKPDFVSVTFGAGGSSREGSYQLVKKLIQEKGLGVIAYLAAYGLAPDEICSILDAYADLGVENILALRGDPPRATEGLTPHPESLAHASDLLHFIKGRYAFCLGGAGHPEGHPEAESKAKDLDYLKLKVANGAEFIIANFVYDTRLFFDFVERCRTIGIGVPILPGVMPIYSVKLLEILTKTCGATIGEEVRKGLAALPADDTKAVAEFGIAFAIKQCRELLEQGVPGIHLYTMDRSAAPLAIVNALKNEKLL